MKKATTNEPVSEDDDMPLEYDFSGKQGVRGKYSRAYQQGHTVKIHKSDGTITVQYFALEDGAVMLEPEVRHYFPNSESVNAALRSLIALIPSVPAQPKSRRKPHKVEVHS